MKRNIHPQRLPPLNVATRIETDTVYKHSESDTASYFQRVALAQQSTPNSSSKAASTHIVEASQTILFAASSLQRTIGRCIGCIGNDSLHAAFSPVLYKSKASTEKLMAILDTIEKRPVADACHELVQATSACISILKELCWTLRTRLSTLVQGLDAKFSRNLLMNLYSATVDMKDAWQVISPYLSVDPMQTLTSFMQSKPSATTPTTPLLKNRSHSELSHSPIASPLSSPNIKEDNTQLYTHLRNAVTSSLYVLNTLKQSIEDTVQDSKIPATLEKKLNELLRQAQHATELSHRLDKNVEANMGSNKEDLLLLPTRKETSRRIWEDTSIYLKAIVSVMTFIRSISTEEDFAWPKSIKQGCLYVTRMTAEVAKLWNSSSTFAEDGYFLGRQERSPSVSEQSTSPYSTSPASAIHYKRLPNYDGWWTQILHRANDPVKQSAQEQPISGRQKAPLPIPFAETTEPTHPIVNSAPKPKLFVHLKGIPVELPEKPEPPENCCMSVWDMYQEDLEDYAVRKQAIKNKFLDAGEPLPNELESSLTVDAVEEMDPTMKAFLEMEKKLNSK
ncbi:hypothetical protein [Parasitella parasitica]|uniref:Oxidoreductase-like domain-containing protein n=1 Tax=Parasitella parasitica TaxID=35722 RepID=A0A0B7N0I2_9FUNG|nr:hypothetical protein [Parasitella parasitica]